MDGREEGGWGERMARWVPLALVLAATVVALFVLRRLVEVLELVAIAMLLALVLRQVVNGLCRFGIKPWMSALLLFGAFLAFGFFVWAVVVPDVIRETQQLLSRAPRELDEAASRSRREQGVFRLLPDLRQIVEQLKGYIAQLDGRLPQLLRRVGPLLFDAVATVFLALFMAIDPGAMVRGLMRLVPAEKRGGVGAFVDDLEVRLRGWIVGTGVAMLFVGGGAGLGLWAIGVPLPVTFGILAGLLNVVPFFGSILGAILPALVALAISPVKALLVAALFLVLNQVDGNLIQPLVMGRQANLHPVLILASFLVFGALLGPAGLLLAVPIAIFLMTLLEHTYLREKPADDGGQGHDGAPGESRLRERGS